MRRASGSPSDPGTCAVMGARAPAVEAHRPSRRDPRAEPGRARDPGDPAPTRRAPRPSTALFEKATAPLPGRKVTYKLKRLDTVVVTARPGPGLSYIRYEAGSAGRARPPFGYDRALAPEVDRLVIAVANAFVLFPDPAARSRPRPTAAIPSGRRPASPEPRPSRRP